MKNKIRLGKVNDIIPENQNYHRSRDSLFITDEVISIDKHSFECNWYWGFGYIGNRNLHCHAEIFTKQLLWSSVKDVFSESIFKTNSQFWTFKDLLIQAYSLKSTAEVFHYGGHCTTNETTGVIKSKELEDIINSKLEIVLNTLWDFLLKLQKDGEK